jgi:hypothetical protein
MRFYRLILRYGVKEVWPMYMKANVPNRLIQGWTHCRITIDALILTPSQLQIVPWSLWKFSPHPGNPFTSNHNALQTNAMSPFKQSGKKVGYMFPPFKSFYKEVNSYTSHFSFGCDCSNSSKNLLLCWSKSYLKNQETVEGVRSKIFVEK